MGSRGKKAGTKTEVKPAWYRRLVGDLRRILAKERLDLLKRKHEIGSRILRERANIPHGEIGDFIRELSTDLGVSWQGLYFCARFAECHPSFSDFSNALEKLPSWFELTQEWLYEARGPRRERGLCEFEKLIGSLHEVVRTQRPDSLDCSRCPIRAECERARGVLG